MTTNHSSDFSFDTYPGLDRDLDEIYARNVEEGTAAPAMLATSGLASVVNEALPPGPQGLEGALEIRDWASPQLAGAIDSWSIYRDQLRESNAGLSPNPEFLASLNPNFAATMQRLFEDKQKLDASNELTPNDEDLGDTMNLVLIPWRLFKNNLTNIRGLVKDMRSNQGGTTQEDYFDDSLMTAVVNNELSYRHPKPFAWPGGFQSRWIKPEEYLEEKIRTDGDWGIMLVQTSDQAGLKRIVEGPENERSPNAMTNNGTEHFMVNEVEVDAMGIFEWLALTLQEDPRELSSTDVSWLLANRLTLDNGEAQVPIGDFDDGQVKSDLNDADNTDDAGRVRLAVM